MNDQLQIICGDAVESLKTLETGSVHCCVTSPPFWGLRDYGCDSQLGLERTPKEYVQKMVEVFGEVRRVMRHDATLWLNLGSSYAGSGKGGNPEGSEWSGFVGNKDRERSAQASAPIVAPGFKPKDLVPIPWMVAMALQADGWWLRQDIIWSKPGPMPESVTDRFCKSHEYIFLLTKSARYFFDQEAVKEKGSGRCPGNVNYKYDGLIGHETKQGILAQSQVPQDSRIKRSVWTINTTPYADAHFATFPPEIPKLCILAGTSVKGCCKECGSPWNRVIERGLTEHDGQTDSAYDKGTTANRLALLRQAARKRGEEYRNENKTLGWEPTCDCIKEFAICDKGLLVIAKIEPCTVLDPFAGSGTTGAVALELGRKAILIELNPRYVELIEQRCDVTMGLALA